MDNGGTRVRRDFRLLEDAVSSRLVQKHLTIPSLAHDDSSIAIR